MKLLENSPNNDVPNCSHDQTSKFGYKVPWGLLSCKRQGHSTHDSRQTLNFKGVVGLKVELFGCITNPNDCSILTIFNVVPAFFLGVICGKYQYAAIVTSIYLRAASGGFKNLVNFLWPPVYPLGSTVNWYIVPLIKNFNNIWSSLTGAL